MMFYHLKIRKFKQESCVTAWGITTGNAYKFNVCFTTHITTHLYN